MSDRTLPLGFLLLLLVAGIACAAAAPVAENRGAARGATPELSGARVRIQLRSGKILADVEVLEPRPGKVPGTVSSLTVVDHATGQRSTLGAAAIQQVTAADGTCHLAYDEAANALIWPNAGNLDEIRRAAQAAQEEKPAARPRSAKSSKRWRDTAEGAQRRQQLEAQRRKEQEEARIAFHKKTGVWLWPELTDEQQQAAVAEEKQFLDKVAAAFANNGMRRYETQYFLFLSDMPVQQVAMYTPYLDKMYYELCKAFAIAKDTNIWRGKAVVIAFTEKDAFVQFEREFFQNDHETAQGVAHQAGNGNVIISCYRGDDLVFFATMLVHETAHGFIHRYQSSRTVPSWLSEGAAEWIAAVVVTGGKTVQRRQQHALQQMREAKTLGGDFFTAANIHDWQYGAASAITDFLLRSDPKEYRTLIKGIKEGLTWQESLQQSYGLSPEQLAQQYGALVGIPGLKP